MTRKLLSVFLKTFIDGDDMEKTHHSRQLLEILRTILTKYLVIISATYQMFRHPHDFSDYIDGSSESVKRSIIYFAEAIVLLFVVPSLVLKDQSSLSFIEQDLMILFSIIIIAAICFVFYHALCFFEKRPLNFWATMSAAFYSYGLVMLCILPSIVIEDLSKLKPSVREALSGFELIMSVIGVYGMYIYVFAFHRWISDINDVSAIKSFFVFWLVAISSTVFFALLPLK
ncbi:hypothetical protein VIBNI_B0506 [Vibrio nigripulchritudo]|uniref:Yip1 domain-containing protein n=2 Tax=Vibrio nigripulchritudo TaxID=28173 RepID=U4KBQ1_9VIBR|nr:hypothetical protein VIBNI_B0506 [Vibrio nigripulchritudo]